MGCGESRARPPGNEHEQRNYVTKAAWVPKEPQSIECDKTAPCNFSSKTPRQPSVSLPSKSTRSSKISLCSRTVSPRESRREKKSRGQTLRTNGQCQRQRRLRTPSSGMNKRPDHCYSHAPCSVKECSISSGSSISSSPQLFRIESRGRAQPRDGTWGWWYEQVARQRITKDYNFRAQLQSIPSSLMRQYDVDKSHVQLDLGWCCMERSAPYVLGRLLSSPFLGELRWVTALRLDGNYFTHDGFGNMLAVMAEANEKKTVLPLLKHLYLNSMNLDPCNVQGILFYLFPLDFTGVAKAARQRTIAGELAGFPQRAYVPFDKLPRSPLFPLLDVLSLCDNPGMGNHGLAEILRCFIAPHLKGRLLSVLDLSRCAIDEVGVRYIREYVAHLREGANNGEKLVVTKRIVLFGNRHSPDRVDTINDNKNNNGISIPHGNDITLVQ